MKNGDGRCCAMSGGVRCGSAAEAFPIGAAEAQSAMAPNEGRVEPAHRLLQQIVQIQSLYPALTRHQQPPPVTNADD